nr:Flp pilus assembly protein CpaB [Alcaligenes faecalis]
MIRAKLLWLCRHPSAGFGLLALLAGLMAAGTSSRYLDRQEEALRQAAHRVQLDRVVAASSLAAGTVLQAEHLAARAFPAELVPSDSWDVAQFENLLGQVLSQPLRAGDLISKAHVQEVSSPFSEQLLSGRRALTVPVDAISSVSGLIRPGDLIDIYVSFDDRQRRVTAPLLQSVLVLATGQKSGEGSATARVDKDAYNTLTLDVGPDDALKLLAARQHGRISALLRNPDDHTPHQAAVRGELADILGLGPGASPKQPVQVLYGNRPAGQLGQADVERLGWLDMPDSFSMGQQP